MEAGDGAAFDRNFTADYVTGFASGRYLGTDNSALNKHVEVLNRFNWDGGSTPPASTIFTRK